MVKNLKKEPKDGDILVLKNNHNIIYKYNGNYNGYESFKYNAFHVALCFWGENDVPTVTHKEHDTEVVSYGAEWEFATDEEIKRFNEGLELATDQKFREHVYENVDNLAELMTELYEIDTDDERIKIVLDTIKSGWIEKIIKDKDNFKKLK